MTDLEHDATEAIHRAEEKAFRKRTPARIAWHMAIVACVACGLLGYVLGYLHH